LAPAPLRPMKVRARLASSSNLGKRMSLAAAFIAKYRDNPKAIAKYLNDALVTSDPGVITKAIGSMVRAQGASAVARKAGQRREGLYRIFGNRSNPPLSKTLAILLALDIQLNAKPVRRRVEPGLKAKGK
jgi:probable addiction module antidote protein